MKNINIIKFYDTTLIVMIISLALVFLIPGESLGIIPSYIFFIAGTIFILGMIINVFGMKRYGWMVAIILLGPIFSTLSYFFILIFPIIFYFSIMRKELKKKVNSNG